MISHGGDFFNNERHDQKDQRQRTRSSEEEEKYREKGAGSVHNTIVLNEKATKQLLSGSDFKLQVNQGMLLDILLKELLAIKAGQTPDNAKTAGVLRVILENPQSLQGFLSPGVSPAQKEDEKANQKAQRKGSNHLLTNESLKDSVFQQSGQSRKPEPARRKDLESINEDQESKGFQDEFESVKDDHMFSLSASHPAKDPGSKFSPSGNKYQNSKNQGHNGGTKPSIHRTLDEGRTV